MSQILLAPLHLAVLPHGGLIGVATTLLGAADLTATACRPTRDGIGAIGRRLLAAWLAAAWLTTTCLRCMRMLFATSIARWLAISLLPGFLALFLTPARSGLLSLILSRSLS
jgi:hypothetical protein